VSGLAELRHSVRVCCTLHCRVNAKYRFDIPMSELASQFHISHFIISQARHASCSMRHSLRHFMQHTAYMPHMPCQSAPYGSTHRNHSATMTHCFTCAGQSAYWHLQRRRGRTHIASAFAMLSLRALHPPTHYSSFVRACVFVCCQAGRLQQRIISNVRARLFKYTIEKALPHEMQA
jgi:hypothetical protein